MEATTETTWIADPMNSNAAARQITISGPAVTQDAVLVQAPRWAYRLMGHRAGRWVLLRLGFGWAYAYHGE